MVAQVMLDFNPTCPFAFVHVAETLAAKVKGASEFTRCYPFSFIVIDNCTIISIAGTISDCGSTSVLKGEIQNQPILEICHGYSPYQHEAYNRYDC
jgi:hypothetical protein